MNILSGVKSVVSRPIVPAQQMRIGEIGIVINDDNYGGTYILRTYNSFVSLDNPAAVWSVNDTSSGPTFDVELYTKPELTLVLKETSHELPPPHP